MIRATLRRLPWLHRHARDLYKGWRRSTADELRRLLGDRVDLTLIQIGSCDGQIGDPLHAMISAHLTWRGVLVEPVPHLFQRLRRTYAGHRGLRFENVAVGTGGTRMFYFVDPVAADRLPMPFYFDQLGSFDRRHIFNELARFATPAQLDPYVREIAVECIDFTELCRRAAIDRFELLHVDAEGADFEILEQVDIERHRPDVILFEHIHLTKDQKTMVLSRLQAAGYRTRAIDADVLATRV